MSKEQTSGNQGLPRTYDDLVAQAKREFDGQQAMSSAQWVAMRARIDDAVAKPPVRGSWSLAGAITALAALTTLSLVVPLEHQEAVAPEVRLATHEQPSSSVGGELDTAPMTATQALAAFSAGQRVVSDAAPVTVDVESSHRFVLGPNSEMVLTEWSRQVRKVTLTQGEVRAFIVPARPEERIEVVTAAATVRVIGTDFSVSVVDGGGTRVEVSHGLVEVRHSVEESLSLAAGDSKTFPLLPVEAQESPKQVESQRPKRTKRQRGAKSGLKIIEIDVPDQVDPAVRLNAQP